MGLYYKPMDALPEQGCVVRIRFFYDNTPEIIHTTMGFLVQTYSDVYFKKQGGGKIPMNNVETWAYITVIPPEEGYTFHPLIPVDECDHPNTREGWICPRCGKDC